MTGAAPAPRRDPYIEYTHRYFKQWLPVYDWFAFTIPTVYHAAVRAVDPRPGQSVLDICTGTGEMALRLARRGATVTGVDVTEPMLLQARRKAGSLPVTFAVMDARRLDLPDRSFDVSILSLALHDMPRRVRVETLREALRVTRERVVIVDYDFRGPAWWRRIVVRLVQTFETHYLKPYSAEGVVPLLDELGARVTRVRRPFPWLFAVFEVRP